MALTALPIDPYLAEIRAKLRESRALVVTAAPGAGKTTRVPPALVDDGPVIVLQPRRIAARSLAARVASEQGWTIGAEVGWHVRFERQFGPRTNLLFATEGILTARLQHDPLLTGFNTIVLDEFHERSIHADLGLALAKQAWRARSDLRIVVMSATLDTSRVADFLEGCPVVDVPGALHPIDVGYAPGDPVAAAVDSCLRAVTGQVLVFLPGAPEIAKTAREVRERIVDRAEIVELHGSMDASSQDAAIAPSPNRRVILATNIAETSLTVPGIAAVVDTGLHKVARYDADRGIDSLDTERVSTDAADQRAGRAGRLGPGIAVRLWSAADRLRPYREPEIHRIDLSAALLDIAAWGGDPESFEWFEAPSRDRVDAGRDLLERLDAMKGGRLTELGSRMRRLPLHPRLSAILLAGNGASDVALACALLSERHYQPPSATAATTTSDLLTATDRRREVSLHVTRTASQLQRLVENRSEAPVDEAAFRRALLAGYPDRVGRRRHPGSLRVLLASGHGAAIGRQSGVRDGEFLIALDVTAGVRGAGAEATIRMASLIEREWLQPTDTRIEHVLDVELGVVRATRREYYDAIVLSERPEVADPIESSRLLVNAFTAAPLSADDEQFVRRLRFAGFDVDVRQLAERASAGMRSLAEVDIRSALSHDERRRLDRDAPEILQVPSGRSATLEYRDDGTVTAAVKLQELFGLADTPGVGPRREPVLLSLLAPNGRPVQMTRDLRSFWERTYPEVRKELRGRYPRHPWPEDPWTAPPTARTTRRGVK